MFITKCRVERVLAAEFQMNSFETVLKVWKYISVFAPTLLHMVRGIYQPPPLDEGPGVPLSMCKYSV
jgi:hypothetical protein